MGGFRLGSVLGFEIRIDGSWFVIFFLLFWSLSAGVFPQDHPGFSRTAYYGAGLATTLFFFASLLAHELSHSVVARAKGIPVEGITLFIFGGIAHTRMEAEDPGDELAIAGIGPLASLVIGGLFGGLAWLSSLTGFSDLTVGSVTYLAWINVILAGFNLLPGFPLDGGRLFRAAAWKATGDVTRATRMASMGGQVLGWLLIGLGALQLMGGGALGGLWFIFIGWFLRTAAQASFRQHVVNHLLRGVPARELMTPPPSSVSPDRTLRELVEGAFLRHRHEGYPVADGKGEGVQGLVTLDQVKEIDRERWDRTRVGEVMTPLDQVDVSPEEPMTSVLERMGDGRKQLLVTRQGRVVGIISPEDVSRWLKIQQDLEDLAPSDLPHPQEG